jgi:undecaprenyl-diphosphatase
MPWWYAVLKGLVQGLAEFLPISSSAHLILMNTLLHRLTGYTPPPQVDEAFDIWLHLGTLLAVVWAFSPILRQLVQPLLTRQWHSPIAMGGGSVWPWRVVVSRIALSFLATTVLVLGVNKLAALLFAYWGGPLAPFEDLADVYFRYPKLMAFNLCITGGLLWWVQGKAPAAGTASSSPVLAEAPPSPAGNDAPATWRQALAVGSMQALAALFRGISRSGSTLVAGLACGWSRPTAATYSFLLSLPILLAAAVYETLSLLKAGFELPALPWGSMGLGFAVSAISGGLCIRWFLGALARCNLRGFSFYCWVLALVLMVTL